MAIFSIGDVLNQWQGAGVFDFLLPFLIVFALVYGILNYSKVLGDNKGIHVIVALAIGLLALQQGIIGRFFAPLFSSLSMGLGVLLVLLLLTGLFIEGEYKKYWYWGYAGVGGLIAIIVVANSFADYGWGAGYYSTNAGWIIGGVLLVGLIIAMVAGGNNRGAGRVAPAPAVGG